MALASGLAEPRSLVLVLRVALGVGLTYYLVGGGWRPPLACLCMVPFKALCPLESILVEPVQAQALPVG